MKRLSLGPPKPAHQTTGSGPEAAPKQKSSMTPSPSLLLPCADLRACFAAALGGTRRRPGDAPAVELRRHRIPEAFLPTAAAATTTTTVGTTTAAVACSLPPFGGRPPCKYGWIDF